MLLRPLHKAQAGVAEIHYQLKAFIVVLTAAGYWWFQQAFSALGYHSGV